jgi:hypothetical protein
MFLTPEEQAYVIFRRSEWSMLGICSHLTLCTEYDSSSVGEEAGFSTKHILAAFGDWQVWLHILIYMSIVAPRTSSSAVEGIRSVTWLLVYGISLFLPYGFLCRTTCHPLTYCDLQVHHQDLRLYFGCE